MREIWFALFGVLTIISVPPGPAAAQHSMLAEAQQGPTASSVSVELGYEGQVLPLSEG